MIQEIEGKIYKWNDVELWILIVRRVARGERVFLEWHYEGWELV